MQDHYETTPELIMKQLKDAQSSFPFLHFADQPVLVDVNEIRPNLGDFYQSHVEELKKLIDDGVPLPPIVIRKPWSLENKFVILDGTHRHLASKAANKQRIYALVKK